MYSLFILVRHSSLRLRYATFKARKCESFYKINTFLQKVTTCIGLQANTYFSILCVAFAAPFLSYFQKLQLLVANKFWTNFCCIVLLYLWAQKVCPRFLKSYFKLEILIILSFVVSLLVDMFNVSQIFKILFQTGDINNFVIRGVIFSRYVQLKSSFSDEKKISGKIWHTLL